MQKKCGNCESWEPLHAGGEHLGDHRSGLCDWLSRQRKPMWLRQEEATLVAQVLAGAGADCDVWEVRLP